MIATTARKKETIMYQKRRSRAASDIETPGSLTPGDSSPASARVGSLMKSSTGRSASRMIRPANPR